MEERSGKLNGVENKGEYLKLSLLQPDGKTIKVYTHQVEIEKYNGMALKCHDCKISEKKGDFGVMKFCWSDSIELLDAPKATAPAKPPETAQGGQNVDWDRKDCLKIRQTVWDTVFMTLAKGGEIPDMEIINKCAEDGVKFVYQMAEVVSLDKDGEPLPF